MPRISNFLYCKEKNIDNIPNLVILHTTVQKCICVYVLEDEILYYFYWSYFRSLTKHIFSCYYQYFNVLLNISQRKQILQELSFIPFSHLFTYSEVILPDFFLWHFYSITSDV